jgi:hypothetical protein
MKYDFEEKLDDLVSEAVKAGVAVDDIIRAFELKTMALNEEAEDAEDSE